MKFQKLNHIVFALALILTLICLSNGASATLYCKFCTNSVSQQCMICDTIPNPACPALPGINLSSPENDFIYNTNRVPIEVKVEENVPEMKITLNGEISYSETLCTNCNSYQGFTRELKQGSYQLCIKVTTQPKGPCQGDNYYPFLDSRCVHIEVRTTALPIILDYTPKNGSVITGLDAEEFSVRYNESSMKNASLIFRKVGEDTYYILTKNDCPSGQNAECTFTADLSGYKNLDKIEYYFRLINTNNGFEFSEHNTVTILRTLSTFEVISPVPGTAYGTTNVPVEVWVNGTMRYIKRAIDGGSYSQLCSACSQYSGNIVFGEGIHTLSIQITDYSYNTAEKNVTIKVDSKLPVISSQTPANNTYAFESTNFNVTYTENYLKEARLSIIRNPGTAEEALDEYILPSCTAGASKTCGKSLNVTSYEPGFRYYFTISDDIRSVSSIPYTIKVDSSLPQIEIISPESRAYGVKAVNFEVSTGKLMKTIKYSLDSSSYTLLCSDCSSYSGQKSYTDGSHTLTILATSKADNNSTNSVSFFIDSVAPVVSSITPINKSFINSPAFSVKYTESYLENIMLFWKGDGEEWQSVTLSGCASGSLVQCASPGYLIPYFGFYPDKGKIEYFFRIKDRARDVNSTVNTVYFDNTAPLLSILSPLNNTAYATTTLSISAEANEKCKSIKYSADGASFTTVCSDCTSGTVSKSFTRTTHTLTVQAQDYSGNIAEKKISFTIN
ncbi:MAG: hypothetical protein NTV63_01825 [Candidatus Woesearchaeota archaeon]|nr:hypothetical protein [Candidatus Woesearchaeota archaeon]